MDLNKLQIIILNCVWNVQKKVKKFMKNINVNMVVKNMIVKNVEMEKVYVSTIEENVFVKNARIHVYVFTIIEKVIVNNVRVQVYVFKRRITCKECKSSQSWL